MPKIIQFTHPGAEHGPDEDNPKHKLWNTGNHKRKFLLAKGEYVENGEKKHGRLMFWGEWEPPSKVEKLETNGNRLYPQWLHRPYLPNPFPTESGLQNTDPFVFGESFKYLVCKQISFKSLTSLDTGSLILFGSTHGKNHNAFFQLDTVFVVSKFKEYDPSDKNALVDLLKSKCIIEDYYQAVFKMAFPSEKTCSKSNAFNLRLYFGATCDDPVEGMYSFSPAKLYNDGKIGFPRIQLKDMCYITNNLNAAPKFSKDKTLNEIKDFWKKVQDISRRSCCVEGVKFNYEKE